MTLLLWSISVDRGYFMPEWPVQDIGLSVVFGLRFRQSTPASKQPEARRSTRQRGQRTPQRKARSAYRLAFTA